MPRVRHGLPLASVWLDTAAQTPLYQQVYAGLKRAILHGQLRPGSRLPSTRTIAGDLHLSRNTVTAAFDQLLAEGYIEARIGSGTRVVSTLPNEFLRPPLESVARSRPSHAATLSRWGTATQKLGAAFHRISAPSPTTDPRPFQSGVPAVDQFPAKLWARYIARAWRAAPRHLLQYGDPAGLLTLREVVAAYASSSRAVRCDPDQVIIVAGSQQGLYLVARVLADPGDCVWIEDPGFPGARNTFQSTGLRLIPVPVDWEGLAVSAARSRVRPRLIYVTPSHQFPLGMTMTLPRRLALLELAERFSAWILEDDYDSEYRYASRPVPSLQGLTEDNRVIYLGTFSKVLAPALRLGYVIVPKPLVDAFRAARALIDMHSPSIDQAALANFMVAGHFERHIRRMRAVYEERRNVLIDGARRELSGLLDLTSPGAGLHLIGWLPYGVSESAAAKAAADYAVTLTPLSALTLKHRRRPGLVLSFGGFTPDQIRAGIVTLARALGTVIKRH